MIFEYYAESDMLTIKLAEGFSSDSEEIAPGVVLDYDEYNHVIGVEIEDASKLIDLSRLELKSLPVSNVVFTERAVALV
ncbi:MAG: DUF2283 domain-containing protein [Ignavibacteriae bacterium]|nr:DUF2283 domain-containing protein [Ignavibacteriota bacterium]